MAVLSDTSYRRGEGVRASARPAKQTYPAPTLSPNMQLSEKIVLAMAVWILFALILSLNSGLEVFLTLILIGVLVIRELTDSFTPTYIKERVDFFIYTFLAVFAIIVVKRVWDILS